MGCLEQATKRLLVSYGEFRVELEPVHAPPRSGSVDWAAASPEQFA
jgi:hypothetical protein